MDLTTNIIQKVYNVSSNDCDSSTQSCTDGYALYVPCIKDITRGQNVCFEFYVTDLSAQDVIDLDTVDDITLTLSGQYGCQYGSFSYPDNIDSLQKYNYSLKYDCTFEGRNLCKLDLISQDKDDLNSCIKSLTPRYFYSGTIVEVEARDMEDYIFIGWAVFEENEECDSSVAEDYIVSYESVYRFVIDDDTYLTALYRKRKTYDIIVDSNNKHSHYSILYKSTIPYQISNRTDEIFNDDYEKLSGVKEGYSMLVEYIPVDGYKLSRWKDGETDYIRIFHPGVDTEQFESGNTIKLYSLSELGQMDADSDSEGYDIFDVFDPDGIYINTPSSLEDETEYGGDEYTKLVNNVFLKHIEDETYLYINNGSLVLSPMDIDEGVKVSILAKAPENEEYDLLVSVNGMDMSYTIDDEENKIYEYYFKDYNDSDIEISASGKCLITEIEVYEVSIKDKGKARLCLDADDVIRDGGSEEDDILFEDIPTGPLYASGAIMIDGNSYGLSQVQIGIINRLNKINII